MHDEGMASDATEFWQRRNEITPSTDVSSTVDEYRLVLLADIADPDVLSECERIFEALDRFECFDPSSSGALHITVKLFDVEVDPSTTGVDDPSPVVRRVDRVVSSVVAGYEPFEAELTRFNLFPDVVYGKVADGGQLTGLNRDICDHSGIAALDRDGDEFIPHLTFGYFGGDSEYGALVEFLEANRELQLPAVQIEKVALVAYEVGGRPPTYNRLKTYEL
jgi:2'-5' RNA ligase